jgi:hypothetical protein
LLCAGRGGERLGRNGKTLGLERGPLPFEIFVNVADTGVKVERNQPLRIC